MSNGFIKSSNAGPVTVTFSGFTPGIMFDMIVYSTSDNTGNGSFSLNNTASTTWNYNIGTGNTATFTENSTKRTLTGLTAVGSSVTLTMTGSATGISGIQFSAIPEPSSALIVALSGLALLARRARRQA